MPKTKKAKITKIKKETKPIKEKKVVQKEVKKEIARYLEAVGRRKTAVARIRLWTKGNGQFSVNAKPYQKYFPTLKFQEIASAAFKKMKCLEQFNIDVVVKGGGFSSQAEAVRHASARVLVLFNQDFKKRLRKVGFLTRDPRMRERKKFGLKRARRAPQWQKR
jgi:small subunit ribosomal protein S9